MKSSFHALGNSETRENYSSGFETIWVEIVNTKAKNVLCCCAYRHPSVSPVRFKEYLESTLSQLTSENKSIFIMGNFNINLLNCESHPESNDFLLMLNSLLFYLISYNEHVLLKDQQPSLIIYLQILML